ncbi:unnamed protein product [Ranitomeya imitator]|uniref:Uncharacterized protein n=1 Tax=Ranitomeya imitator TaxID=111125 RepID=A0ABN9MPH6_9NEOB|nr:unnamed protein product [Ranitomeya imitator]
MKERFSERGYPKTLLTVARHSTPKPKASGISSQSIERRSSLIRWKFALLKFSALSLYVGGCLFLWGISLRQGETTQVVHDRISQHKSNIRCNRDHLPLPHHFRTMGHNIAQFKFQVVEQIEQGHRGQNRVKLLRKRESYWIFTLQTLEPKGLNRDYDMSSFL